MTTGIDPWQIPTEIAEIIARYAVDHMLDNESIYEDVWANAPDNLTDDAYDALHNKVRFIMKNYKITFKEN